MALILIAEDDKPINDLIRMNLELVGYACMQVYSGFEARDVMETTRPDLVLLDVMIPDIDGFTLLETQVFRGVPVILVTAKDTVTDKVNGLKLGADDYLTKPFEAVELLARVEAVLRRCGQGGKVFRIRDTVIRPEEHTAEVGGRPVELTNREFELLTVLVNNRNLALSREKLIELAWGWDYCGDTRTVDVHITKLRKKLHLENDIHTVYKYGYRLEVKA